MNRYQIEGMRARANVDSRHNSNPYAQNSVAAAQWQAGYDQMKIQIEEIVHNAEEMLATLQFLSRPNPAHVDAKAVQRGGPIHAPTQAPANPAAT